MQIFTANDAKQNFGQVMDSALQEPVSITKHGRPSVVITSDSEYRELLRIKYDRLKADVQAGFEALERGEGIAIETEDDLKAVMDQIKSRGRSNLAKRSE
ncbi:type II toxin-antitoxin system Phd/YefM family antitoxin [Cerasicoccus maritimus]|uniref:type II toxin-antitoxin system Phd/YefM family antitoxin n=1 Tax=Cerasicoccus maritimus TaxID=490089 RepID=UPI0028527CD2|nr:type II toxin-antitoxin system Phd/YefM family antitoxin [Cerasicoccus maritimus]